MRLGSTDRLNRPGEAVRPKILLWLALLALLLQSLVVQTHVHRPSEESPGYRVAGSAVAVQKPAPADHSTCPLCTEMALSGHYVPPTPAIIIPPLALAFWIFLSPATAMARIERAHHWQSRAPPLHPAF